MASDGGLATRSRFSPPTFQSLTTRSWILLCFYATVLVSLPFWHRTTTIQRLALPRAQVQEWESRLPCPVRFRHTITLRLPPNVESDPILSRELARGLNAASDGVWLSEEELEAAYSGPDAGPQEHDNEASASSAPRRPVPLEHAACIDWNVRLGESAKLLPSSMHYVISLTDGDATDSFLSTSTTRRFSLNVKTPLKGQKPAEAAWSLAWQLSHILQLPYRDLFFHATLPTIGEDPNSAMTKENILNQIDRSEADKRIIPYTHKVRLVFSIVNEDAAANVHVTDTKSLAGVAGWDAAEARKAFSKRIGPLVEAMQGTHKIAAEMQTIWFAPLSFEPNVVKVARATKSSARPSPSFTPAEQDSSEVEEEAGEHLERLSPVEEELDTIHIVRHDDLQVFVDSGAWGLTSSASSSASSGTDSSLEMLVEANERTLHFIVFIAKPSHRPLRIANNVQATNFSRAFGWLVPQWGGVSLYNLGYEEGDYFDEQRWDLERKGSLLRSLTPEALDKAFTAFSKQLSTLLGLRTIEQSLEALPSTDARLAIALDALARRRILGSVRESVRTLASIVRLVDKIKILGVGAEVQADVGHAITMLERAMFDSSHADLLLRQGSSSTLPAPLSPFLHLLEMSYAAELLSSRAFFNPNMLGQLYFPDEHKYAVYTPLFGPLAMPLLVAGVRLFKERRRKRRDEESRHGDEGKAISSSRRKASKKAHAVEAQ